MGDPRPGDAAALDPLGLADGSAASRSRILSRRRKDGRRFTAEYAPHGEHLREAILVAEGRIRPGGNNRGSRMIGPASQRSARLVPLFQWIIELVDSRNRRRCDEPNALAAYCPALCYRRWCARLMCSQKHVLAILLRSAHLRPDSTKVGDNLNSKVVLTQLNSSFSPAAPGGKWISDRRLSSEARISSSCAR